MEVVPLPGFLTDVADVFFGGEGGDCGWWGEGMEGWMGAEVCEGNGSPVFWLVWCDV